ncbi:hypothetical protein K461DRAFT_263383 [Myriangium duriaei CBS 260.36]|uniref:DAGKc domain-containing protein n=1 Tax=Myriangium duriaei CBS 260.36 TaxID=1168546 RepID=A0A9P4IU56_9PEZI|nr:hypothetical protein K461DRAFT_263383 [Myriangium duriaei CBS 260.36]
MSWDGRSGSWTIFGDDKPTLQFTSERQEEQKAGPRIPTASIVGTWPVENSSGQFVLIHVQHREDFTDPSDSPIFVQYARVTGLPTEIIQQYLIKPQDCALLSGVEGTAETRPEISVIISTESGAKQASGFFKRGLKSVLETLGVYSHCKIYVTESEQSITGFARSIFAPKSLEGIKQTVILLSGDGGTIDLVNVLAEEVKGRQHAPVTLIPLPLGSGNALSNSYKYNQDDTMGLSTLVRGRRRTLPIFRVAFSSGARLVANQGREEHELPLYDGQPSMYGVVVCSWGLHASLVADSDTAHYRQFGSARFQMVAKQLMFPEDGSPMHEYTGRVSFLKGDGGEKTVLERNSHSYVLATLVSNLEKTFCISPDSKALDGELRLVELPAMAGEELTTVMMAAYNDGQHVHNKRVGYHTIDRLEIAFEEEDEKWRRVCIDGKIVKIDKGGYLRLTKEGDGLVNLVCLQTKE